MAEDDDGDFPEHVKTAMQHVPAEDDFRQFAKSVVPFIERHIESRNLTVEFLSEWGSFCECAVLVQEASIEATASAKYLRDGLLQSYRPKWSGTPRSFAH